MVNKSYEFQSRIRTRDLLALSANDPPADLSWTNLVDISYSANFIDNDTWSVILKKSIENIAETPVNAGYIITLD